jgi:hypothetical protein
MDEAIQFYKATATPTSANPIDALLRILMAIELVDLRYKKARSANVLRQAPQAGIKTSRPPQSFYGTRRPRESSLWGLFLQHAANRNPQVTDPGLFRYELV